MHLPSYQPRCVHIDPAVSEMQVDEWDEQVLGRVEGEVASWIASNRQGFDEVEKVREGRRLGGVEDGGRGRRQEGGGREADAGRDAALTGAVVGEGGGDAGHGRAVAHVDGHRPLRHALAAGRCTSRRSTTPRSSRVCAR